MYTKTTSLIDPEIQGGKMDPSVVIAFDFGLTVSLEADMSSFFAQTFDTDSSFKLCCSHCKERFVRTRTRSTATHYICDDCKHVSGYLASAEILWLSAHGVKLEIEKAYKRDELAEGKNFQTMNPQQVEAFLGSEEFVHNLIAWVEPYFDSIEAPIVAWELSEELDRIWLEWKKVKRIRGTEKKKAALDDFCAIETNTILGAIDE